MYTRFHFGACFKWENKMPLHALNSPTINQRFFTVNQFNSTGLRWCAWLLFSTSSDKSHPNNLIFPTLIFARTEYAPNRVGPGQLSTTKYFASWLTVTSHCVTCLWVINWHLKTLQRLQPTAVCVWTSYFVNSQFSSHSRILSTASWSDLCVLFRSWFNMPNWVKSH